MASSPEARNVGWLAVAVGLVILLIDVLIQLGDFRPGVDARLFALGLLIAGGFLATNGS